MAVSRGNNIAQTDEREMRFIPFASDTEIKLTVAIVTNLICIPTRSGHRCTPQDAIRFMMMCQSRRLNPFEGDAFLQGYDSAKGPQFSLITAHQAFLKRAEVNKEYDGMESGVIVRAKGDIDDGDKELEGDFFNTAKYVLVGGWARVHHKGRKVPTYRRLDLDVFRKVDRDGKPYGRWADDPAGMIVKCAEADALRSTFPSMLGNLYLEQELNPDNGEKNVTPPPKIEAPSFMAPEALPPAAPEPTPANVAPLPGEEPEPEKPKTTRPPTAPLPDVTAHLDTGKNPSAVIDFIKELAKRDGVNDDQITGHLRNTKLAKKDQHWPDLSDSKLRTLANAWDRELSAMKAIQV